jgi:hypothetical protein
VVVAPGAGSSFRAVVGARWTLGAIALAIAAVVAGCGPPPDAGPRTPREFVLSYDDNRPSASLVFPSLTYESILRLELPEGKHRPLRLRLQAAAAGTLAITVYENDLLESPGEPIFELTRELGVEDVSTGKDGRWAIEDLRERPELKGVVWIGMRKMGGEPAIWTSSVVSGQAYLRDRDPKRSMGLLPVKRTPMLRLEVLP